MHSMKPAWIKAIKRGDVLKSGTGKLRVVRHVSHNEIPGYGIRTSVVFAIQHCFWTHRCYTIYNGSDLVQMKYRPTKASVSLRKKIDKAIDAELFRRGSIKEAKLKCCDVDGVP